MKIKVKLFFLGLKDVKWNEKYEFHITPVLTYAKTNHKTIVTHTVGLEWGHWAVGVHFAKFPEIND